MIDNPLIKIQLPTNKGPRAFTIFLNSKNIFKEVIEGKTYPIVPFVYRPRTIVDIGANIGSSVLFFNTCYPEAKIWAFEPSPETYRILNENVCWMDQVKALNIGLSDRDASMKLYKGTSDSVTNSIGISEYNSPDYDIVTVKNAKTHFLTNNITNIDVLKIDTEGCEVPILQSIRPMLAQISVVYLEFHSHDDRILIDSILAASHYLYRGHIVNPHRGEVCYVARHAFPSIEDANRDKIRLQ